MAKRPFTMHPHGVSYEKSSEGAIYDDFTSKEFKRDDVVMPGQIHVYKWEINSENGPAKGDQSCIPSVYHSHVVVPRDINTGLIGMTFSVVRDSISKHATPVSEDVKQMCSLIFLIVTIYCSSDCKV